MTSDHLYIIGNGFDCYHGAKCSYAEFRKYLLRHRPYVLATFDLYFGPRSLMNSFESNQGLLEVSRDFMGMLIWRRLPKDNMGREQSVVAV